MCQLHTVCPCAACGERERPKPSCLLWCHSLGFLLLLEIFWPKSFFKLVSERKAEQQIEVLYCDEKVYQRKIPWIANCNKEELFAHKRGYQSYHSTCVNQQVQIRLSPSHGIGSIRPSNLNNLVYNSFSSLHKNYFLSFLLSFSLCCCCLLPSLSLNSN